MFANPFPFCIKTILQFLALSVPLIAAQLTAAPVVSNLTASQRAGTKLVDIGYDLTTTGFPTVAVSLEISSDGGVTWTVPVSTASGDIGSSVAPGAGKDIVWSKGTFNHARANYRRSSSNSYNQSSICSPLPGYAGLSRHTIRQWGALGRAGMDFTTRQETRLSSAWTGRGLATTRRALTWPTMQKKGFIRE